MELQGKVFVLTDDAYLAMGLVAFIEQYPSYLKGRDIVFIDLDRFRKISHIYRLISHQSDDAIIIGISRDGVISRQFSQGPVIQIGESFRLKSNKIQGLSINFFHKNNWLIACDASWSYSRLTKVQMDIFLRLRQGHTLPQIARLTGKTLRLCYSHATAMMTRLNIRNLRELCYFAKYC